MDSTQKLASGYAISFEINLCLAFLIGPKEMIKFRPKDPNNATIVSVHALSQNSRIPSRACMVGMRKRR